LVQRVSKRQESAFMAFSAGVMLAAAIFALLLPSLAAGQAMLAATSFAPTGAAALTSLGLLLGMGLMLAIDKALPHEHAVLPPAAQGHATQWTAAGEAASQAQRSWMMVLAILIHNLPEGLAVGAAYAGAGVGMPSEGVRQTGASVALAIGLQNMPEGLSGHGAAFAGQGRGLVVGGGGAFGTGRAAGCHSWPVGAGQLAGVLPGGAGVGSRRHDLRGEPRDHS
jgi:ZIP family zinc transporter